MLLCKYLNKHACFTLFTSNKPLIERHNSEHSDSIEGSTKALSPMFSFLQLTQQLHDNEGGEKDGFCFRPKISRCRAALPRGHVWD